MFIELNNISKSFKLFKREAGLKGALQSFLKRNYQEVECDTIVEDQHILHIISFNTKTKSWLIFLSTHKKPK